MLANRDGKERGKKWNRILLNTKVLICWYCKIFWLPCRLKAVLVTVRKILSSYGSPLPVNNPGAHTHSARECDAKDIFCFVGDFFLVWLIDFFFFFLQTGWCWCFRGLSFSTDTLLLKSLSFFGIILCEETSVLQLPASVLSCMPVVIELVFVALGVGFQTVDHLCIMLPSLLPSLLYYALENSA